jgi:hypothetical protein
MGEQSSDLDGKDTPNFDEMRKFFRGNFNTGLDQEDEFRFHGWMDEQSKFLGRDLSDDLDDYDLRGAYLEVCDCDDDMISWPSKFKKPNHPTFARDSIYHGAENTMTGGEFEGGDWGHREEDGEKVTTFRPSAKMLEWTHPEKWLKGHFARQLPDVELLIDSDDE